MPELVHAVRGYLRALGLEIDEQGDFLIEAANAMEALFTSRRPIRLSSRLRSPGCELRRRRP